MPGKKNPKDNPETQPPPNATPRRVNPRSLTLLILAAVALAIAVAFLTGNAMGKDGETEADGDEGTPVPTATAPMATFAEASPTPTSASSRTVSLSVGAWGPAGPAPQKVEDAARVLETDVQFLTLLNPKPGDDLVIGWVIGTTATERVLGMQLSAKNIPVGTCVDYDPGASEVTGRFVHQQDFTSMWRRVLMESDGTFQGLKITAYWTPCVFTDGFKTVTGPTTSSEASSVAISSICPSYAEAVAERTNSDAANWVQHPQFPNGWIYAGPIIEGFDVPAGGKVDYDGGSAESGSVPEGSAFTYWCPK